MSKIVSMSLKLLTICAAAAFALGVVNALTAPEIKKLEDSAKVKALGELIKTGVADPASESFVEGHDYVSSVFEIKDGGSVTGYILNLKAKGYGGIMTVMASYKSNGEVINAVLMANAETPGFGKKAEKDGYMDKFVGRGADGKPLPLFAYEVEETVDTVTGATITFMGISSAIKSGSDYIKGGM